jgi:hypothetical protein
MAISTKSGWSRTTAGLGRSRHVDAGPRPKLTSAILLAAKEHAAVGIGMIFDPLDPAAASEKLLHGFFRLLGFIEQQHSGLPRHLDHFALGDGGQIARRQTLYNRFR